MSIEAGQIWYVGKTPVLIEKVCKVKVRVHSNYNPTLNHKLIKPHWLSLDGSLPSHVNIYSETLEDYKVGDDISVWKMMSSWCREYKKKIALC